MVKFIHKTVKHSTHISMRHLGKDLETGHSNLQLYNFPIFRITQKKNGCYDVQLFRDYKSKWHPDTLLAYKGPVVRVLADI